MNLRPVKALARVGGTAKVRGPPGYAGYSPDILTPRSRLRGDPGSRAPLPRLCRVLPRLRGGEEDLPDGPQDVLGYRLLGLPGQSREVRRQQHVLEAAQRVIGWRRLLRTHIERSASQGSRAQRIRQRDLVHNATPGGIDQYRAWRHEGQLGPTDQVP